MVFPRPEQNSNGGFLYVLVIWIVWIMGYRLLRRWMDAITDAEAEEEEGEDVKTVSKIFARVQQAGGRPLLVGGGVRDKLLNLVPKDFDIEVFGVAPYELGEILREFGRVDQVGASFGVFKLRVGDEEFDVSVPRRESKSGTGHKGFIPEPDPTMSIKDAAARRDFTINSMSHDPETGEVFDYYHGQEDLMNRVLRHTSIAFIEDDLRVLRAMQLASRFEMVVAPETAALCLSMRVGYSFISKERIWGEWFKLAAKGVKPSMGLKALLHTGWVYLYPELEALIGCPQDPEWHPEGTVWAHTLHVADKAAEIAIREGLNEEDRVVLVLAGLCHDLAKPRTTTHDPDGHVRSKGHASEGMTETRTFLDSIGCPIKIIDQVIPLVKEHLSHLSISKDSDKGIRRLAVRLAPSDILQWVRVVEADHSGRPPLPVGSPAEWVAIRAKEIGVLDKKPDPILQGRHLIDLGMTPGPTFGPILKDAYEAQLDGDFMDLEGARKWVAAR